MNIATKSSFVLNRRHLLGIEGLSFDEITGLLDLSEEFVTLNRQIEKKRTSLRGRTQINLFFESSTRTQASFELAGKRLGADVMNMAVEFVRHEKGRDADRHGDDAQRHASGYSGDAASCVRRGRAALAESRRLGHQCRRRRARASDAGAARRAHHPPQQGPHRRPDRRDLRRHPAFAGRALQHHPAQRARRARAPGRALDAAARPASSASASRSRATCARVSPAPIS